MQVDDLKVNLPHHGMVGVEFSLHLGTSVQMKTYFGLSVTINNRGRVTIQLPLMYRYGLLIDHC